MSIFEDELLLVVTKPPGVAVAPGKGVPRGAPTVLERWQAEAGRQGGESLLNAHRIDVEVSGVLILTKTKAALDFVSGEFQSKMAQRVMEGFVVVAREEELAQTVAIAPVRGADGSLPDRFEVGYGLGPDLEVPGRMHVYRKRGGRPARTVVRVLERFGGGRWCWIEAEPETSRDQQVQAHLAAVGAPVVGDAAHGLPEARLLLSQFKRGYKGRADERPMVDGLALHLARITLRHPATREQVTFAAPRPKGFEIALKNLRKFVR
ncbi:RluA family pseudouridine synthase [Actomonas aquatica]|uniref:Pseudouridine synthase n=1 Tax=Actomonas aquatica TaxID=2866162 RepID=A0ABZ1CF83_9BACT|nr:pseudouridine synthase [Opitutus sp. WL0086]WRQ90121.1 pseudouridine synthase [Opitutus sp. WL0086]